MTIEEAIKIFESWVECNYKPTQDAAVLAIAVLRAQQEREKAERQTALRTEWETPESCPNCMEHLALCWSFCPTCGRPTNWSGNEPLEF